jgi:CBS domain-containing protein
MGEKDVRPGSDTEQLRVFTKRLLDDLRALEQIIDRGLVESGIRRIGAEQELFLVDDHWRPATAATEVLEVIDDPRVTGELGRFNLEFNLDPREFGGDCLSSLEREIEHLLGLVRAAAAECGVQVVLTGILPTLRKSDLSLENMTPEPRYYALNDALTRLSGGPYKFRIQGTDDLLISHDSIMLEAANTSFQVHFQVGPGEFAKLYNIALAVTAPVMAAATNSPLLFGRRLWRETRIALFQQSIDTRGGAPDLRDLPPRVRFGGRWVDRSILEIFKEDIAQFDVVLASDMGADEDPFESIEQGRAAPLRALMLHNSTVYRWNRPCYGVKDGVAHLRIENRVLPSGPTPVDEMANAAFWFGLMAGLAEEHEDIRTVMAFDDAKSNFIAAGRLGLGAHFQWLNGDVYSAPDLIQQRLVPLAREALTEVGIDREDIERYLGVIEARVGGRRTGADWLIQSLAAMKDPSTMDERLCALTGATVSRQENGQPVHTWKLASLEESGGWRPSFMYVEQYMNTAPITVHKDAPIDLVANLLDWHRIQHIPVEAEGHRLVGLVSHRSLLRFLAGEERNRHHGPVPVSEIMHRDLVTVTPDVSTIDAIKLMREHKIGCLPVVSKGKLVGLVTEREFTGIAGNLLEKMLRE